MDKDGLERLDLVMRLRNWPTGSPSPALMKEAADEIERLRRLLLPTSIKDQLGKKI